MNDHKDLFVPTLSSVRDVLAAINRNGKGIVAAVDDQQRFLATLTDGDLRRALLAGLKLDDLVTGLVERKRTDGSRPVTAPLDTPKAQLVRLMQETKLRQIPLLDASRRVVSIVTLEELVPDIAPPARALVMAGGKGTRLRPLTAVTPKPMLPVGAKPLLEIIVEQLRGAGIRQLSISTHYHGEQIERHFGDGERFGVSINYCPEDEPGGTAGALASLDEWNEPILVINGDVLTSVDFRAMYEFHREQKADVTIGVRRYDLGVPYGVVDMDGPRVRALQEKPTYQFYVNGGVYLVNPRVKPLIPAGRRFDMPDLISALLQRGWPVASFPIVEYWLDIGHPDDYARATADVLEGRFGQ